MIINLESILSNDEKDKFKSEGERRIANLLDRNNIKYFYEQGVLVINDGKPKIWHPDYFLPEYGIYIEYYGMAGDPDYDRGIEKKNRVYAEMGLEVIPVYPWIFKTTWENYIINKVFEISKSRYDKVSKIFYQRNSIESVVENSSLFRRYSPDNIYSNTFY